MELKNLILASSTSPGVQVGSQRTENGVPVFRFKKEVIRCGEFYKDADNLEFSVSRDTLNHWAAEFSRWTQNGNKVAVPETHRGAQDPTKNRGWVLDMFTEGDSLYAVMDLYGEDAPKIAATNDVSIYSLPVVVDGTGVKYSRPITHIALCTDPVIPGLSKFEAIMCSRKETFQLAKESTGEGRWITVRGTRIHIADGEDVGEVIGKKFGSKGGGSKGASSGDKDSFIKSVKAKLLKDHDIEITDDEDEDIAKAFKSGKSVEKFVKSRAKLEDDEEAHDSVTSKPDNSWKKKVTFDKFKSNTISSKSGDSTIIKTKGGMKLGSIEKDKNSRSGGLKLKVNGIDGYFPSADEEDALEQLYDMTGKNVKLSSERKSDMDIMKLAATLGLSFGDKITDAEKEVAIECALADLKKAAEEKKPKKKQKLDEDGEPMVDENDEPIYEDDEEEEKPIAAAGKKKAIKASRTPDPLLIKLSSENRSIKLDRLVEAGQITAATRAKLAAKYVDEKALTLSLGRGGDDFDEIVLILSQNDIVELGEKSNRQTLELGDALKGKENPLLANAKARSEKASK